YPDGENQEILVPLLGRSVVSNLLAAVALADSLGVPRELFPTVLSQLKPIPHRLSLSKLPQGVTIIDDSYNSNPIGARDALEVLRSITSGRRVLITSGMIELGSQEKEANYQMGKESANSCDLVALVGKMRVDAIYQGLRDAGFQESMIFRYHTTSDALKALLPQLHEGDVVLIENDLPDQYLGL
ncbi:MAG: glutamate ligase domain-containing protein, partial [bacterium]